MDFDQLRRDPQIWRPQAQFSASIRSKHELDSFNDIGAIAVYIDINLSERPDIAICGSQSETLSFWETNSSGGFLTKPKFTAELLTFRFVRCGQIVYRYQKYETIASKMIAVLADFESLREVQALGTVSTLSATIAAATLASAQKALSGGEHLGLPTLERVADMAMPGMWGLFCTVRLIHSRIGDPDKQSDLMFPLLQEMMGYQILSAWPKFSRSTPTIPVDFASQQLRRAIDYIEGHLFRPMILADVAAAANTGVRSLQSKFKSELGVTPLQYIISRRLARAHEDLISRKEISISINEIARKWGFVHMSDFGKRYRKQYGCTPSETRRAVR